MMKCSPVDMRKTLLIVDEMKKSGIRFVPIPVLNDDDLNALTNLMYDKLNLIKDSVARD